MLATYLTSHVHGHLLRFDIALVHDFDGDLLTGLLMDAKLNPAKKPTQDMMDRAGKEQTRLVDLPTYSGVVDKFQRWPRGRLATSG